jgi:hypothetical protein
VRAIANEKIKVFFGHVPVTIEKGQEVSGELAAFLLKSAPGKVTGEGAEREPEAPPTELDVDASAAVVLAWVGDDPGRAAVALEAEQAKGEEARSTLTKKLEKLAAVES